MISSHFAEPVEADEVDLTQSATASGDETDQEPEVDEQQQQVELMAVPLMPESLMAEYICLSDIKPSHFRLSRTVDRVTFSRVEIKIQNFN